MKKLVSIIICTCNRPESIEETFQSLLQQKVDGCFEWELIVVENNPTSLMKATIDTFSDRFEGRLHYFLEPQKGKSYALNRGIGESKGELLLFTDDDATADPAWLTTMVQLFDKYNCDGVGGRVLPVYPDGTPQWIKDNAAKLAGAVVIYDYGQATFQYRDDMHAFIGANFAFKRSVFTETGLFRTDLGPGTPVMGEDTELTERLAKRGKMLYYCGNAVVWHPFDPKRLTLKHMANWHIQLGRFAARREVELNEKIASYFLGVPRYLYKGILLDGCSIIFSLFDRMKFLNSWRAFFRKVGMIEEYMKHQNINSKKN